VLIVLLSSFGLWEDTLLPAQGAPYTTPDTGVNWTIQMLAVNSSGTVTYSGSVFYIHDMLTVSATDTLVIPPGTILKVDKDKRIDIKGRLYAVGNSTSPIEFTSNLPSPKPGDWMGLRFNDAKSTSILKHSVVEYAYDGVYIYKGSLKIESNEIQNISFRGVYCREDSANVINNTIHRIHNPDTKSMDEGTGVKAFNSYAKISGNRIYDVQTSGVKLDYSDCTVYKNNISQARYGINVFRSEPKLLNNTIWNNSQGIVLWENVFVEVGGNMIVDNIELGIYFHRTSPDIHHNTIKSTGIGIKNYYTYDNATIRDNDIILNEVSGITLDELNNVVIKNNYIWHNFYEPIYGKQMKNFVIKNNIIERNEDDGIQVVDSTDVTIDGNTIDDTRGGNGVYLDNTKQIKFFQNTIKDAGFNSIKLVSSTVTQMRHNEIIDSHQKDVWLDDSKIIATNLSFDRSNVRITSDSRLLHKNLLTVRVQDNYQTSIMGANVTVKDDNNQIYKKQTDNYGEVPNLLVTDLIYEGKDTFKDNVTTVFVDYGTFVFDNNPRTINMSASHMEVFGRNRLPEVHITKPDNKQEVSGQIFVNGTAFDPDGLIQSVEVSFDNTTWHKTTAKGLYWSKWSYVWNTTDVNDGDYFISVRVFDMLNYSFDSIQVVVDNDKGQGIESIIDVLIYSPFEYQEVRGKYPILGTAFSTFGEIIGVEVSIDNGTYELATPGERIVSKFNPDKGKYEDVIEPDWNIWGYEWNTTLYEDGEHTIRAKVQDTMSKFDFVEVIAVVDNLKGDTVVSVLEITKPTDGQVVSDVTEISGRYWGSSYATPAIHLKIGLEGSWFKPIVIQWYDWWLFNYDWDTSTYNDGIYEVFVKVKAMDEELVSSKIAIVNNGGGGSDFGIKITTPAESETLNGTFNVEGYVWNYGITIMEIKIRVDNNPWEEVVNFEQKHISDDDDGGGGGAPAESEGPSMDIYWVTWEYPLDTRPYRDGIHVIQVKSSDSANTTFSSVTVIFVNKEYQPDEVIDDELIDDILDIQFITPKNGAIVSDSITMEGMAWSHFGNITSVEVQIDELGFIPATASINDWSTWEYNWDTSIHKNGIHKLSARVTAELSEQVFSKTEVILVIVNNQVEGPGQSLSEKEVIILHPRDNDIVSGVVELYGIGWINNGTIKEVQLKIDDGIWLQAEPTHSDWLTWNYNLNTLNYTNGRHTLTARLNTGDALVNSSIAFFVNNTKDTETPDNGVDGDKDNGNKPTTDDGSVTNAEGDETNDMFIQALTFAIVILVVFLIIISIFIYRLQKKPSKESDLETDKPSKDIFGKPKGKKKDLGGDLSALDESQVEDERIEIESDIFDEDEDDEVIVIRAEVKRKTALPKPPKVSSGVPAVDSKKLDAGKPPTPLDARKTASLTIPEKKAIPEAKPVKELPDAKVESDDVKEEAKGPKAKTPTPVPVPVPAPAPTPVPTAKAASVPKAVPTPVPVVKAKEDKAEKGKADLVEDAGKKKSAPSAIPVAVPAESGIKDAGIKQIQSLEEKIEILNKKLREGKIDRVKYEKLKADYIDQEPKEALPAAMAKPAPAAVDKKPPMNCQNCGKPPRYISAYKSWYCSSCKKYVVREVSSNGKK
jgi:parallel beta-helix repeat protein